MQKRVLDAQKLIGYWNKRRPKDLSRASESDAARWAEELIAIEDSNAIVSPVYVEVICGCNSAHNLRLTRVYLSKFRVIDGWVLSKEDWMEAIRIAERIPAGGGARQLGDCLIAAIAQRRGYDVLTRDAGFPRTRKSRGPNR